MPKEAPSKPMGAFVLAVPGRPCNFLRPARVSRDMEPSHTELSERASPQDKKVLAERDARIAELTHALAHEREQAAYMKEVLQTIASSSGAAEMRASISNVSVPSGRPSRFRRISTTSVLENWVANLLAGGTLPVLLLAGTSAYSMASRLDWRIPENQIYA